MMVMYLLDSRTNKHQIIKPDRPLRLFVCGPTVYDYMHIGHARTYLTFDALVRFLRSQNFSVRYIQNITDVDDKIINRARERQIKANVVASEFYKKYIISSKALNIKSVDKYIKASAVVKNIKSQISRLIDLGYAYETELGVYFRVLKFKRYGALSKQKLDELEVGSRVDLDPSKENPLDFAIWKRSTALDEPSWPSPWGRGRPGWHIEDTAISEKEFGLNYELHGGATDLKFPHHESEIAIAETLSGQTPFVKIWLHTGFLLVEGVKMSKSLNNFITVNDFLKSYNANVLRFMSLSRHYRSPFDYKSDLIDQSLNSLLTIKSFLSRLSQLPWPEGQTAFITKTVSRFSRDFTKALSHDFNTPVALASLFSLIGEIDNHIASLKQADAILLINSITSALDSLGFTIHPEKLSAEIKQLLKKRQAFRLDKQFAAADKIRDNLAERGYVIEDNPLGASLYLNNFIIS